MNSLDRILHQRHKEQRALRLFLLCSVLGSLAAHAIAMTVQVGNFWNPVVDSTHEDDVEVVLEDVPVDQSAAEKIVTEPEEPPTAVATVQEVAIASQLAPAPIPLAPENQSPLPAGQATPSKDAPTPKSDPVSPMTNQAGETPTQSNGSGSVTKPDGKGFGFGFSRFGTGFNLDGKPTGKPDGQLGGQENGRSGGDPNGKPTGQSTGAPNGKPNATAVRTAPPKSDRSKKPVCLDCPKPRFRDSEGSARVTYDIGPDGRVTNVRLRQSSGNSEVDRETLETLSKWRFDPKTIPEGGRQNVRTRVTFEEEGSTYQRQNEQRRQVADQEQPQRQAEPVKQQPATAVNEAPVKPTPLPTNQPDAVPQYPHGVKPASQSTPVPPPVEPADLPPPPKLAPAIVEPPPAPMEARPLPAEPAPVDVTPPAPISGNSAP